MRFSISAGSIFLALLLGHKITQGQVAAPIVSNAPKLESGKPVSERTGEEGCWILISSPLGKLADRPVFWTLDRYPTRQNALSAVKNNSTVVEALGQVWLFTVGDKVGISSLGVRVTEIGPIPIRAGENYTGQYRESIMQPAAISRTHRHSGPEIFYTEAGQTCLETPAGKEIGRKGENIIVPEGEPMELVATGSQQRRGIVLVLHSSEKPHTTLVTDWTSKGLCKMTH